MGYKKNIIIGIYTITNTINGLKYVGGTINIDRRWQQHRKSLKNNSHRSIYLQADYNKYGESAFEYKIIEQLTDKSQLLIREQYWYDKYEPFKRENGYNVNLNAKDWTGRKHFPEAVAKIKEAKANISDDTRRKISESCMGRPSSFKGKRHSQETKDYFSLIKMGKKLSEEHRRKLSTSFKKNITKYSDDILLKAINMSFNGHNYKDVSKELGIYRRYYLSILRRERKAFFYDDNILPRIKNGEILTIL